MVLLGGGYFTGMLNYRVPREGEGKGGSTCIAQVSTFLDTF